VGFLLVLALAFLLASFPARHSDLWKHLAEGRFLIQGDHARDGGAGLSGAHPGNRSWLFDLGCYGLYTALGGEGLMLVKALLVVAVAVLLLRLSRAEHGWFIAAACTALALLAMGTRLFLQLALLSCIFLALTLFLLRRQEQKSAGRLPSLLPPWPLVLLFVLWVNTDVWFVLGLAIVGVVWLGRTLDEDPGPDGSRLAILLRRVGALVLLTAACLLNPAHIHAFTSLRDLGGVLEPTSTRASLTSPFQRAYFQTVGQSPTGLAYFPLLVLGLLSFGLNVRRPQWQRLLPFLTLAVLTVVQVRTIPFFAVVAGPVLAWNLQSWWVRRTATARPPTAGLHSLALIMTLLLVVCAWPGWLQGGPYEPRRWTVEPPPAVELAAAAVKRWHAEGKLTGATRGLHLSPDSANAFAWFCPEDDGAVDPYLTAAIRAEPGSRFEDLPERMRTARVDHFIVYDSDRTRFHATLELLWLKPAFNPVQCPLLYLEGNLAIFGWRDLAAPVAADPFRDRQLNLQRRAFAPERDKQAPRQAPDREPQVRPWWEALWKPAPARPVEQDEAAVYLLAAKVAERFAPDVNFGRWGLDQRAALVAAAGSWAGGGALTPAAALLDVHVRLTSLDPQPPPPGAADGQAALRREVWDWYRQYALRQDDAPPALLYLAVRAARRALAANPDDAEAHLVLGDSYVRFLRSTRERAWASQMPDLVELRRVQASAALNRAVALRPNLAPAHLSLAGLYRGMGYLDLALNHLRTYVRLLHNATLERGESAEARRQREAVYQDELSRLAREVEDRENTVAAAASGGTVLDRANLAAQKGLAGRALDILLQSDVSAFGDKGMELELRLLLTTGRSRDARDWTAPEDRARLGPSAYHWLRIQALAAAGDYELAQEECTAMADRLALAGPGREPLPFRETIALMVGQMVLDERPGEGPVAYLARRAPAKLGMLERLPQLAQRLTQHAHVNVLRGLIALEEGRVSEARFFFHEALDLWKDEAAAARGAGLDFAGRVVAQGCLELLE